MLHSPVQNKYLEGRWSGCSVPPPVAEKLAHPAPEVGSDQTHAVDQPNVPSSDKVLHGFSFTLHQPTAGLFLCLATKDTAQP